MGIHSLSPAYPQLVNFFLTRLYTYFLFDNFNIILKFFIRSKFIGNFVSPMDYRGMIFFTEKLPYISEGGFREIPAQIHNHLAGEDIFGISLFGGNIFRVYTIMLRNHADDEFRGYFVCF